MALDKQISLPIMKLSLSWIVLVSFHAYLICCLFVLVLSKQRQADVNSLMLLLALLCHLLPMLFTFAAGASASVTSDPSLHLSRASCIVMLIAYTAYIVFQLWTHRELFEAQEVINARFFYEYKWFDSLSPNISLTREHYSKKMVPVLMQDLEEKFLGILWQH